ncbi:LPS export ABC transporter periplasmic protein LptC [Gammaproteobacteria bacterium AB-CW1]|uniref:LPS export ABC transporter periplasmic protein LptC n=1 Tax=Natronospira elongata TaxID=3110268 RepID=A0AAP6MKX3_9GAMM|nr:LPS export ABC transporter periplasmic protein LptC [Gammaproteobacteria bacterium AB-CW1]
MARWALGLLLAIGLILSLWLMGDREAPSLPQPEPPPEAAVHPDYWISGAQIQRYDADGQPLARLNAEELANYPDDQRSELRQVQIHREPVAGLSWDIRADHGMVSGDSDHVHLYGDVRIERHRQTRLTASLFSDSLDYFPEQELLLTDEPVRMEQGPSQTTGRGMRAELDKDRIKILSEVRTRHVPRD